MNKHTIPALILSGMLLTGSVLCAVMPKDEFSESERRKLAEMPKFTQQNWLSGKFANEFETYATDNFPFRELFRTIKSVANYNIFAKSDNNDIYIYEDSMMKLEKTLNEVSVKNALSKFEYLYNKFIKDKAENVYTCIVPDKAYFAWLDGKNIPSLDYERLFALVKEGMPYSEHIDITDSLTLSDFYKTDSHWRQEKISKVAQKLASEMGVTLKEEYTEVNSGIDFKGVYSGQSAKPNSFESLVYLTNETLESAVVENHETGKTGGVYDKEKLTSRDPYEVFLHGSCAAMTITNPKNESGRELIIFRDSYGSSITPLLLEGYSKITLLDIRYMASDLCGNYTDFEGADVLFLYSSTLINNSGTFK